MYHTTMWFKIEIKNKVTYSQEDYGRRHAKIRFLTPQTHFPQMIRTTNHDAKA